MYNRIYAANCTLHLEVLFEIHQVSFGFPLTDSNRVFILDECLETLATAPELFYKYLIYL